MMSKRSGFGSTGGWRSFAWGLLSIVLVVAFAGAAVLLGPPPAWVDGASGSTARTNTVSRRDVLAFCPARMSLSESDKIGDEQFRASEGDLKSAARYTAFGPVFASKVDTLSGGNPLVLGDQDPLDGEQVMVAGGDVDQGATIQTTSLLKAEPGAGSAASIASWATKGDMTGVQALTCPGAAMTSSFLLPATKRGWTQKLMAYNPSSKPTVVTVTLWGSKEAGRIASGTHSSVTLEPGGQSQLDVAAAAPGQDAVFMVVSSSQAPVATAVCVQAMDGLKPLGSDYVSTASEPSKQAVIPGLRATDKTTLIVYGNKASTVKAYWLGDDGRQEAAEAKIMSGQVTLPDLGQAPKGTRALQVESDDPVRVAAWVRRDGEGGQADFSVIQAQPLLPVTQGPSSVIPLPGAVSSELTLVNAEGGEAGARLTAFDDQGKKLAQKDLEVKEGTALAVSMDDLSDGAAAITLGVTQGRLAWNARLGSRDVDRASVAGLAHIAPGSLRPSTLAVLSGPVEGMIR